MLARIYLRASTKDQDAKRAEADLRAYAKEHGLKVIATYVENESGAKLERPELNRLLDDANEEDILLIEQVDRLSRLDATDWERLKLSIKDKGIRIVALDLPTSNVMFQNDSFTQSILKAVNDLLLDVLAATSRKDYEDRRRRQAQGIAKAKGEGKYRGRPTNEGKLERIQRLLMNGMSYTDIQSDVGCSRGTIAKAAKLLRERA